MASYGGCNYSLETPLMVRAIFDIPSFPTSLLRDEPLEFSMKTIAAVTFEPKKAA